MFDLATNRKVYTDWRHCLAFGFGSGLARYAPGTFGTLASIPLYLLIARFPGWLYLVTLVAAFALGVWVCDVVSRDLRVHDHGGIVFDEFVGYWITMFLVPATWQWIAAGFVAFRVFDIWKPGPVRWCDEHLKGGFGVMFDDVVAGVCAWIALQLVRVAAGA